MRFAQSRLAPRQILIGLLQAFFRKLALRDVPKNSLNADDLAFGVVNRSLYNIHVSLLTARRDVFFHGLKSAPGLNYMLVIFLILGRQFGWKEIEVGLPDHFRKRLAENRAESLVCEG